MTNTSARNPIYFTEVQYLFKYFEIIFFFENQAYYQVPRLGLSQFLEIYGYRIPWL